LTTQPLFSAARKQYHAALLQSILTADASGVPSNAESSSNASRQLAQGIYAQIATETAAVARGSGQSAGRKFENITQEFIDTTFRLLGHLRPGKWDIRSAGPRNIAHFEQYAHLIALTAAARADKALAAALQSDYTIQPDIIIAREPEDDATINAEGPLVDASVAFRSSLRKSFADRAILHASISTKWTLRSNRAQNARSEALNLLRNRKGPVPHIVVVTGEPLPSRIASLALGTGDIDCVYHFALNELIETVNSSTWEDTKELLAIMVDGKRLKDIADLPLDLAI
jgi:hypothetical protein